MLSKPTFRGALVEMVVVVASILVAFGLDAGWDGLQDREEERRILLALADEFGTVQEVIEEETLFHEDVGAAALGLIETAAGDPMSLTPDSVDNLLADLCWSGGEYHYPFEATASVISTGKLSLIQNEELRHLLAGWPRVIEDILEDERYEREVMHTRWWPYMMENAYVPQLQEWFVDPPGLLEAAVLHTIPQRTEPMDHRLLLRDPVFENILLFRLWSQDDILSDFVEFQDQLDQLITLTEQELGDR